MTDAQFGNALRAMYLEEGWTLERIAAQLGCTVPAVTYHMNKHGIRRRSRGRKRADFAVPERFLKR